MKFNDVKFICKLIEFASLHPEKIAVETLENKISYIELLKEISIFYAYYKNNGLTSGDYIAISISRKSYLPAAIIAAMTAKLIFIPLTNETLAEVHESVHLDIKPKLILDDTTAENILLNVEEHNNLMSDWGGVYDCDALAYLIYTSGSTGKPKGVQVTHGALVNVLVAIGDRIRIDSSDCLVAINSLSFDISLLEILMPLYFGASVFLVPRSIAKDGFALANFLDTSSASILQATPGTWNMLLEANWKNKSNLRGLCGGEVLPRKLANQLLNLVPCLWNVYGPTETTIWSTIKRVNYSDNEVPIGKPIANTSCFVIKANKIINSVNEVGELYIGGLGLSKGYVNDELLTKQAFIKLPLMDQLLYKTGDLVKYNENNDLVFVGREDRQIKHLGHRIELRSIELELERLPGINRARVIYHGETTNTKRLKAYVQSSLDSNKIFELPDMDVSLFFFSAKYDPNNGKHPYKLITESAKFADQHGLTAIWMPERHFDLVGGCYPSPTVLAANLASITKTLQLRAGSIVLPLHHPVRLAEEWSMIDALSNGRVGIAFAHGWHPQDFILAPKQFSQRHKIFLNKFSIFQALWAGNKVDFLDGESTKRTVQIYPKPQQKHLPIWITAAGNPETFKLAGQLGANILTHFIEQDFDSLASKIKVYHNSLRKNGFNPHEKTVTVMLHTFIAETDDEAINEAKTPLKNYFQAHSRLLSKIYNFDSENENNIINDGRLEAAINRYIDGHALIGSLESCNRLVERLHTIGVTELACLIDFGIDDEKVLNHLSFIAKLHHVVSLGMRKNLPSMNEEFLKKNLSARIPDYMIPAEFRFVEHFPLNAHGKIADNLLSNNYQSDKPNLLSALDLSDDAVDVINKSILSSDDSISIRIKTIWESVLGHPISSLDVNFFEIGGHSLLATQVLSRIRKNLGVAISLEQFFNNASISTLSKLLDDIQNNTTGLINEKESEKIKYIPLSFTQERMYFLYRSEPTSLRYNDTFQYHIYGKFYPKILTEAVQLLIDHNKILRTTFEIEKGKPVQKIHEKLASHLPIIEAKDKVDLQLFQLAAKPFKLDETLLFRLFLVRISEKHYILLISIHHIITDGWSMSVFIKKLSDYYNRLLSGESINDHDQNKFQYSDFAIEQRQKMTALAFNNDVHFWESLLHDCPSELSLPTDKVRPEIENFYGGRENFTIEKMASKKIYKLCQDLQVTLFTILLYSYSAMLSKYSNQNNLVIGVPIANRDQVELEELLGCFVNVLPIRINLPLDQVVKNAIDELSILLFKAYSHQNVPIERIVSQINQKRDLSKHPLFQTMLVLHNTPLRQLNLVGAKTEEVNFRLPLSRLDILLGVEEVDDKLECYFEYNVDLFSKNTIKKMSIAFQSLLTNLPDLLEATCADFDNLLPKLDVSEYESLRIIDLWKAQLASHVNKTVVTDKEKTLTFKECNDQALLVATYLQQNYIKPGDRIILCLNPCADVIVLLLACAYLGVAYTSLPEDIPEQRYQDILSSLMPSLVVYQESKPSFLYNLKHSIRTICITDVFYTDISHSNNIDSISHADLPLYIAYTSGSTGEPKGVIVSQKAVCHFVKSSSHMCFNDTSIVAQLAPLSFDASTLEIWSTILSGASLVIIDKNCLLSPPSLLHTFQEYSINTCYMNASLFQTYLISLPELFSNMKTVIFGGETIDVNVFRRYLLSDVKKPKHLLNGYGPTEVTTFATIYSIPTSFGIKEYLPIGKPLPHIELLVLDENKQPVQQGMRGELYIGGASLADGYWSNSHLTDERFIYLKYGSQQKRFYRTGDQVYYDPFEGYVFVQRLDNLFKLKGYWIDPIKIEKEILNFPSVQRAFVAKETLNNMPSLVAYLEKAKNSNNSAIEKIFQWHSLYEHLYQHQLFDNDDNNDLSLIGWQSSYTQKPFSKDEMKEWIDATVAKLKEIPLSSKTVLEIGVGTGLLLKRLINDVDTYVGIDFSQSVIDQLKADTSLDHSKLILHAVAAHEIDKVANAGEFDVIILNSIIQYFPDSDYLKNCLEKCLSLLNPSSGMLFIGDIRYFEFLECFQASVMRFRLPEDTQTEFIYKKIQNAMDQEKELLVSPHFFEQFSKNLSVESILHQTLKQGEYKNEMLLYRYDVMLYIGQSLKSYMPDCIDWEILPLSIEDLKTRLAHTKENFFGIRNIKNSRLEDDLNFLAWLKSDSSKKLNEYNPLKYNEGLEPSDFYNLANELDWKVKVFLSDNHDYYHVIFYRNNEDNTLPLIDFKLTKQKKLANVPVKPNLDFVALRSHLENVLPIQLIPNRFITLDHFPLNAQGKLDKKKLLSLSEPQVGHKVNNNELLDNFIHNTLFNIWRDILKLQVNSFDDNFFQIGGDSIICIHMISEASNHGLVISPKEVFRYQTINALAGHLALNKKPSRRTIESDTIHTVTKDGLKSYPLTPIQLWFFELNLLNPHHWNQAFLVKLSRYIPANIIENALTKVYEHHDALRLHYEHHGDGQWTQIIHKNYEGIKIEMIDLSVFDEPIAKIEMEKLSQHAQATLHITDGPLFRGLIFILPNRQQRLLIVIHHLLIDSVSWYILFQDLELLITQYEKNQVPQLADKTTSFNHWANYLKQHTNSDSVHNEINYWNSISKLALPIPRDYLDQTNLERDTQSVYVTVNAEVTQTILRSLPKVYSHSVNTILLTALTIAYQKWTGQSGLYINIDGHGREDLCSDVSLVKTVGWFTAVHPVYLVANEYDLLKSFEQIDQALSLPENNGINYGLLKYLCDNLSIKAMLKDTPIPEIGFNYFGQFFQNFSSDSLFDRADENPGQYRGGENSRIYLIEVNGYIYQSQLKFRFDFSEKVHKKSSIQQFAQYFSDVLHNTSRLDKEHFKKQVQSCIIPLTDTLINEGKVPLFMVHPIGGRVHWYQQLAKHLSRHFVVFGIEALSFNVVPSYYSVNALAKYYAEAIEASIQNKQVVIGGWSFGAEVAFELTKILLSNGYEVLLTFCLDPQTLVEDPTRLFQGIQQSVKNEYAVQIKSPNDARVFQSINTIIDYLANDAELTYLEDNLTSYALEDLRESFRVYCYHLQAMYAYQKSGNIQNIIMFQAKDGFPSEQLSITENASPEIWFQGSAGQFESISLPGNHYDQVKQEDNVKYIAKEIIKRTLSAEQHLLD